MQVRDFMDFGQSIKVADVYNRISINYQTGDVSSMIYEKYEECKAVFDKKCSDFYNPKLMEIYTYEKPASDVFTVKDRKTGEVVYKMYYHIVAFKFTGITNK